MEEGDRCKLEIAEREEATQTYFDGVEEHVFSIIPFDKNDETSFASSDDDGDFLGGEENITAILDRDALRAEGSKSFADNTKDCKNNVTGAAEGVRGLPQLQ